MQIYDRDFSEQSNRPFVEPSRPLGSSLTQTLNRELHIPEGESQADDPAAATCLGMGDCSWEPRAAGMPSCAEGGHRGLGPCAAQGDDPSGIISLENRWRSPKLWVTAMSRVTTVPRALGIRQRESSALRLILFFFLQCRTKEVASSFVQNTLLPCVQQVLWYRSAAQLHPFAWLQQAQHGCIAPAQQARPFGWGKGLGGSSSQLWGSTPCFCNTAKWDLPSDRVEKACTPQSAAISFKRYCPLLNPVECSVDE